MVNGLYLEKPGQLTWIDVPVQERLHDDDVKIRVIYGGICGSDIAVYQGKLTHAHYPVIPGHEILGEVVEAGAKAGLKVGQRVVVQPNSYCGTCEQCQAGNANICSGKKSLGINNQGGFSEEFIISSQYVIEVPDALVNERAIFIEPLAVIVHAFKKVSVTKDTAIAIVGCGTEGMLAVALASYYGAKITAVDINDEKLNKAKQHYPNIEICRPEEVSDNQFDVVMEVAGVKSAFEQCIEIVKPGGAIVAIGLPPTAEIPVVTLVRKEITVYGSIIYNVPDDFTKSIDYLLDASFHVEPIISEIISINHFSEAYEKAVSGDYRKIILSFDESISST
ncbi:zinc-binding dehydrogenase [Oceanobacillus sp. CFH 90083]|uniref:zinc-dependent alcohol dehydrogenase n=1 Tax=Oceanobacillus sp. CFH 90083 TaxID=2592336 RepID=UPI00128D5BEE|nr:alcohol dehydrogenase catalytic domain-containing protein [Oceanobacillus sp. CFH 90083]